MGLLPEQILELLAKSPGLTDREITNRLRGTSDPQQPINIAARGLATKGLLLRKKRPDGLIGNYPGGTTLPEPVQIARTLPADGRNQLSEDSAKEILRIWLEGNGWKCRIAWGKERGIDIDATRESQCWIIEVKGIGSRPEMRVNYFIGMLGETLQRMNDPLAKYSIAVPDVPQFRNLWGRLPAEAKLRTKITALFVADDGAVVED